MRRLVAAVVLVIALGSCGDGRRAEVASELTPPSSAPAQDRTALIVGDSVMWDATPGFEAALRANGFAEVVGQAVLGMGLTKTDYYDWRVEWRRLLDEVHPQAVVVHTGAWDVAPPVIEGREVEPGTEQWRAWFRPLADDAMSLLRSGGADVYWIGALPYAIPNSQPRTVALNEELAAAAQRHPGVHFIDGVAPLVGPDRWFAPTLPGDTGAEELVRKKDGVHLCAPGVTRLAQSLLRTIGGQNLSWVEGEWRFDERYRRVIEGCVTG